MKYPPLYGPLRLAMLGALLALAFGARADQLPRPPALEPAVDFWTRIYSAVSTDGGLLHDRNNLAVVYEELSFEHNRWHPARDRKIRRTRAHYGRILKRLARGTRSGLSAEEQRVLALWPDDVSNARLRRAAHDIRFQLGQSDKFRRGLIRAGAWEPHMRQILDRMNLPPELAALPHVESSFNPEAYSRLGAAGVWQFTRLTGRRFMRVDHIVDERMDPFAATEAAGRLLKQNYQITGDWALAITAYNHGLAGIRRAARSVGSKNIADIIERYDGRLWGFASRNFYVSFLAAVEVDENAEKYFGDYHPEPPLISETVKLPFYTTVDAVLAAHPVDRATLHELNRGLREVVWAGEKYIPKGYQLRLPAGEDQPPVDSVLAGIGSDQRFAAQVPDVQHVVQRGESLSGIAARYDTSVRDLMIMNNLRSAHRIRAGQTLRLPLEGEQPIQGDIYRVAAGDTLSDIARRAGLATRELAAANDLATNATLQVGQTLDVSPEDEGRAESTRQPVEPVTATIPLPPASPGWPGNDPVGALTDRIAELTGPAPGPPAGTPSLAATLATPSIPPLVSRPGLDRELTADPSDYSVADDASIEIQAAETLGHYAEWLDLRAQDLRDLNGMHYGEPLVIGERLELDFAEVSPATFERRRKRYHRELQAAFFEEHHIRGARTHVIERGDSLWSLTRPNTEVPVWLLRQYNPDLDFNTLKPGTRVQVPILENQATGDVAQNEAG